MIREEMKTKKVDDCIIVGKTKKNNDSSQNDGRGKKGCKKG
jgi:hypothetical protein